MPKRNKPTIKQIASITGVSVATVSRVINQNGPVSQETRNRIMEVVRETGYETVHPIPAKEASHRQILICCPTMDNPCNEDIITGANAAAQRHGYRGFIYIAPNSKNSILDYEEILSENSFDGILLIHDVWSRELLDRLRVKHPVVMCSEHTDHPDISYVTIDDFSSSRNAVDYLLSIGHSKIAFMNSSLTENYARERERGFLYAIKKAGKPVFPDWIVHISDVNFELALAAANTLLKALEIPDAIFCVSDVYAVAALKAVASAGLSVPDDISIVGFDNVSLSKMAVPAITTISQPRYQLGYQACEMLIDQIEVPSLKAQHVVLDTELIIRESTAAKRAPTFIITQSQSHRN